MAIVVNPAAQAAADIIKATIQNVAEPAIEAAAIADWAPLGIPPLRWLLDAVVKWVGGYFNVASADAMVALVIDIQVNGEDSEAGKAMSDLNKAIAAGDQSAIDKASADFDAAYRKLVHWDGQAVITRLRRRIGRMFARHSPR